MGEDKALIPFDGCSSLAQYQYKRLSPYFSKTYISSKSNKFDFNVDTIIDENQTTSSPMVALKTILSSLNANTTKVFIITVDSPLVSIETIKKIIDNSDNYDITVANTDKIQNLCGVFSKNIIPMINNCLSCDVHKINKLIFEANHHFIEFKDKKYEKEFININSKSDFFALLNYKLN